MIPPGQTSRGRPDRDLDRRHRPPAPAQRRRARGADLDLLASDDAQQDGRPNDGFARSLRQAAATWTRSGAATFALTAFERATSVVNLADRNPTAPGALLYTQHVPTSDAGLRARWDRPLGGGGPGPWWRSAGW